MLVRTMTLPQFEIYKDKDGEYRWHLRATNNKIIADSGEGYKEKTDCEHGVNLVKKEAPIAVIQYV
jgi:uncharacterized protein YegP (UPF0339 family)